MQRPAWPRRPVTSPPHIEATASKRPQLRCDRSIDATASNRDLATQCPIRAIHARALRTRREVFNALRYVLLNRKHHAAEQRFNKYWVDPFSSGPWFTGWAEPISRHAWAVEDLVGTPAPTKPPTVWLLTTGWKQHGPLRFDDRPA